MSGLFSEINMLLCSTLRIRNDGLLAKTFQTFLKSPIRKAGSDFWQALIEKTTGAETINNQDNKYNSWDIFREDNFHPWRQVLKVKCLRIMTHVYNLVDLCFNRLPAVCCFPRWIRGKNISQSFLFTTKRMTEYSSERFLSSMCGQKVSKGFKCSVYTRSDHSVRYKSCKLA